MSRIDAIYARQSVDKPDSISIESQIELCKYETHGSPYQVYCDQGFSGKNIDRPQFQKLLSAVKNGEIARVICYKLDRCSRSILDFTQLMALFQSCHVEFVSCTEKFDTSTPMGRAMLNICIVFAQLERETIQQRITDAYHSRCKRGYFMGGRIPFGFRLQPYILEGKRTSRYSVVDEEAQIIKLMYSVYESPSASLSDIVSELKKEKISNPRRDDGFWIRPHIGRMLKNPIYVRADESIYRYFQERNTVLDNEPDTFIGVNGCYLYKICDQEHLVLAPHQGIVPADVWLRCQRKGRKNPAFTGKTTAYPSWLSGKMTCEKCGYAVIIRTTKGNNGRMYRYFVCSKAQGTDRQCEGFPAKRVETVEKAVSFEIDTRLRYFLKRMSPDALNHDATQTIHKALRSLAETWEDHGNNVLIHLEKQFLDLGQQVHQLQLMQKQCGTVPTNPDTKGLQATLTHWQDADSRFKESVAHLMISSVKLDDHSLTILWRI